MTLRFERPISQADLTPWRDVCALYSTQKVDEATKLQLMKRLLARGVPLRKHCERGGSPHQTTLYINETTVFWEVRTAQKQHAETATLSRKYDLTRGCSLYDLKYIRIGKMTPQLRRSAANSDHCFSIFANNRTLDFEVTEVEGSTALAKEGRNTLAWAFDSIVREARGSKIFVDKSGAPTRRAKPQKRLRVLL
jgi:hypothetical protein